MGHIQKTDRLINWSKLIIFTISIIVVIAGCSNTNESNTSDSEGEVLEIQIGSIDSKDSGTWNVINEFKTVMEEELGDEVEIKIYPDSQLGTYREMVEQIANNSLEAIYESVGILETWSPLAGIETTPYLYNDEEHFSRVWNSEESHEYLDALAEDSGFRMVGPSFRGFRQLTVNKEIETVDDLSGIKLRVPAIEAYANVWKTLGVSPTPVDFEETYTAIQQGLVEGQENPLSIIMDHRIHEVSDYLVLTNHMAETVGFIFNEDWYNNLNDTQKDAIEKAALASAELSLEMTKETEIEMIEEMKEQGVTVLEPNLDSFREKVVDMKVEGELEPWIERFREIE